MSRPPLIHAPWTLTFRGWLHVCLSDGALAVIAPHLPQLREWLR